MENKIVVSIVTPAFNAERFIGQTIESVLAQTFQDWELLVIDDCSSDETCGIVTDYTFKDNRIKLEKLRSNSGSAVARNKALDMACGEFIAFLDADDLWLPDKLMRQVGFCKKNEISFCFGSYNKISEDGNVIGKLVDGKGQDTIDYSALLKKQVVLGCLTVMIRADVIGNKRMKPLSTGQDFVFWLDILRAGTVAYNIKDCLALYRITKGSNSRNKIKRAKQQWFIYRKTVGLSVLEAGWYFLNYALRSLLRG